VVILILHAARTSYYTKVRHSTQKLEVATAPHCLKREFLRGLLAIMVSLLRRCRRTTVNAHLVREHCFLDFRALSSLHDLSASIGTATSSDCSVYVSLVPGSHSVHRQHQLQRPLAQVCDGFTPHPPQLALQKYRSALMFTSLDRRQLGMVQEQ
jgi:hypothetical protein